MENKLILWKISLVFFLRKSKCVIKTPASTELTLRGIVRKVIRLQICLDLIPSRPFGYKRPLDGEGWAGLDSLGRWGSPLRRNLLLWGLQSQLNLLIGNEDCFLVSSYHMTSLSVITVLAVLTQGRNLFSYWKWNTKDPLSIVLTLCSFVPTRLFHGRKCVDFITRENLH